MAWHGRAGRGEEGLMAEFEYPREFLGVWIPREIYLDDRLSPTDKILLAELQSLDGADGCYASNKYLAGFCQTSQRSINRTLAQLAEFGLIRADGYRGRCRRWRTCAKMAQVPTPKWRKYLRQSGAPVIQGEIQERKKEEEPPKTAVVVPYSDQLEKKLEKAKTDGNLASVLLFGMEKLHRRPFACYPKERKAAAKLATMIQTVCNGQPPIAFAHNLLQAYLYKRTTSRGEYWKEAPISPSGLMARLDQTVAAMTKIAEDEEAAEIGIRAMRNAKARGMR
jgi:hypothetical protein